MTEKPLVSVIINCYNGEKYLREAIDSVIAQTYENWELVFWDNQSTDSTREIVESYKNPKIKYFYAPEHTTLGKARNLAVEKAKGEYINFLDADDVWMSEKLEKQIALVIPGKVEVVYTGYYVQVERQESERKKTLLANNREEKLKRLTNGSVYQSLLIHNFIIFSSVLFNKKLFVSVGGIDDSFNQNEDYDILLKCSLKTEIQTIGGKYVIYRVHDSNNSKINGISFILENRLILSRLPYSIYVKNADKRNEIRYSISLIRQRKICEGIKHYIHEGDLIELLKILWWKFNGV